PLEFRDPLLRTARTMIQKIAEGKTSRHKQKIARKKKLSTGCFPTPSKLMVERNPKQLPAPKTIVESSVTRGATKPRCLRCCSSIQPSTGSWFSAFRGNVLQRHMSGE